MSDETGVERVREETTQGPETHDADALLSASADVSRNAELDAGLIPAHVEENIASPALSLSEDSSLHETSQMPDDPGLPPHPAYSFPGNPEPKITRTPNFLDATLFLVLMTGGLVVSVIVLAAAVFLHWFGLQGAEDAAKNSTVVLGIQLLMYLAALVVAVPVFQGLWGKSFFSGLHWHGARAFQRWYWLIPTAFGCNLLAIVSDRFLPFPEHAPIDAMIKTSQDAWMMTIFGITIAPFFEEMIFRGFLLPATATAWDWCIERMTGAKPRPLDAESNPQWSVGAMIVAALLVSAPFAWMHSAQVAFSWGPLILLYCVSLVLCAVRFAMRSLAASTMVHSAYNAVLFAVMFAQTDGFRHMDKM